MSGLFGLFSGGMERKAAASSTYGHADMVWNALFGHQPASSGVTITWRQALEVTTALRCAAVIAEGVCSVPFKLYRRTKDDKGRVREEARDHPLYDLLATEPNDWMTGFELRETLAMHVVFCGNAYALLNRVQGKVAEIIPYEPGQVSVERQADWSLVYRATGPDGVQQRLEPGQIWHLRGRSWNGYTGLETIQLARETLGLAVAIEQGQGASHKNGVRPSGLLTTASVMDADKFKLWRTLIDKQFAGRLNDGKAMILDGDAKWTPIQLTAADAQTIETRRFQIERICEAFGVLPIMVGAGDKTASYASSEQMFLQHLVHTVRPWHRRFEQSADRWLLTKKERQAGYYFGFVDTELLRGDHKARAEYYRARWGMGSLTGNEIRAFEDEPPLDGLDRPWGPMNTAPIGEDGRPILPPKVNSAPVGENPEDNPNG